MLAPAFEGRMRAQYNLTEPSAWRALERDARLQTEAVASIAGATVAPRLAGVEGARRFDPEAIRFDSNDVFDQYRTAEPKKI